MSRPSSYLTTLTILIPMSVAAVMASCGDDAINQQPPKIYFASDGTFEIAPDDTLTLEPRIIYDYGCAYRWTSSDGDVLSTDRDLEFIPTNMRDYSLRFEVSNSLGTDSYDISVSVLLKAGFGDLDNFSTKKSSVLAMLPDTLPGAFRWRGVEFYNVVNADTTMWAGFAYSNKTSLANTISNSAIGTAYAISSSSSSSSDKSYMAVNTAGGAGIIKFDRAYTPKSVDVANDNFIYLASKFGYSAISKAGDTTTVSPATHGDYYTVVIEGFDENGNISSASQEFKLVDCDYDNPAKYYRCSTWESVDLKNLGAVCGIRIRVETSMSQFPELVCIDNLRLQD